MNKNLCTECVAVIDRGYIVADGAEVFCTKECLYKTYSQAEYREMHKNGLAYYDVWKSASGNE